MKIRIATWNIDRAKTVLPIQEMISTISADLLVLTESANTIHLSSPHNCVNSQEYERFKGYPWVTIWTKWKILTQVTTSDPYRTTSCLVESPLGPLIIYGTIIPYQMAGVKGNRYPVSGKRPWQMHLEDILFQSDDWSKLTSAYPGVPLVVAGDFNQTRDSNPGGYGSKEGRRSLSIELLKNNLTCVTEVDYKSTGHLKAHPRTGKTRRNIDHICVSTDLLNQVSMTTGAWDNFNPKGKLMSDHNGVYIDIQTGNGTTNPEAPMSFLPSELFGSKPKLK